MLALLCTLLFTHSAQAKDLSVFWWNIGGANWWSPDPQQTWKPPYSKDPLEKNILNIAKGPQSPDVMIFCEYWSGFIGDQTLDALVNIYPYNYSLPYNTNGRPFAILVLSKTKFDYRYQRNALHWADAKTEEIENKKHPTYTRSYQRLTFNIDGHELNIVPLHAVEPWADMVEEDASKPGAIKSTVNKLFPKHQSNAEHFVGKAETFLNMMFTKKNPSAYQAQIFQNKLADDKATGGHAESAFWLFVGDFNLPSHYKGFTPKAFKIFSKGFKEAPGSSYHPYSFPSVTAGYYSSYPPMTLDHALIQGTGFSAHTVMGLENGLDSGSDHYPLTITLHSQ